MVRNYEEDYFYIRRITEHRGVVTCIHFPFLYSKTLYYFITSTSFTDWYPGSSVQYNLEDRITNQYWNSRYKGLQVIYIMKGHWYDIRASLLLLLYPSNIFFHINRNMVLGNSYHLYVFTSNAVSLQISCVVYYKTWY